MPLYDFECPHGHQFEKNVPIANREEPVPCDGTVNRLLDDEELAAFAGANPDAQDVAVIQGFEIEWVPIDPKAPNGKPTERVAVKKVPCILKAKRITISFSESNHILDHGSASNRDAAREGRYDPLNPNRRFMAKGRQWRK